MCILGGKEGVCVCVCVCVKEGILRRRKVCGRPREGKGKSQEGVGGGKGNVNTI